MTKENKIELIRGQLPKINILVGFGIVGFFSLKSSGLSHVYITSLMYKV
jgi:hypothetical protein